MAYDDEADDDADLDMRPRRPKKKGSDSLPVLCVVVFIMDLVFMALRALMVLGGVAGFMFLRNNPNTPSALLTSAVFEIAFGAGMALFGIIGSGAMLARQRWGMIPAALKIMANLGSVGVAVWQLSMIDQIAPAPPNMDPATFRTAQMAGAAFALIVRLGLLGLYAAAVVAFMRWSEERDTRHGR